MGGVGVGVHVWCTCYKRCHYRQPLQYSAGSHTKISCSSEHIMLIDESNLLAEVEEGHGKKTANDGLSLSLTQQLLPLKLDLMTFINLRMHVHVHGQ